MHGYWPCTGNPFFASMIYRIAVISLQLVIMLHKIEKVNKGSFKSAILLHETPKNKCKHLQNCSQDLQKGQNSFKSAFLLHKKS
jgi:hypothetical protein